MVKKLEILLIEDDTYACEEFSCLIDESEDMTLIGMTNNASKALEYIKDFLPDVIILDLELHLGGGSGLNVLSGMKNLSLDRIPYILVTTNNSSQLTYDTVRSLGADYIMSKHQSDYSAHSVLDFLRILSPTILSRHEKNEIEQFTTSPIYNKKRTLRRISSELNHVGINPKTVGYRYLSDAIEIMMKQRTQNIANILAQRYNKTEASITRAMQNAIERAWKTTDVDDLLQYYTAKINIEKGVPTVTEFICYYADKLNNEY